MLFPRGKHWELAHGVLLIHILLITYGCSLRAYMTAYDRVSYADREYKDLGYLWIASLIV